MQEQEKAIAPRQAGAEAEAERTAVVPAAPGAALTATPVVEPSAPHANPLGNVSLVVATTGFLAAKLGWEAVFPGTGHGLAHGVTVAFFEAAMVGGLADWFAVTALFRHPLGLPIPHTALLKERKEQIAANVGVFVQDQLKPEVLQKQIAAYNFGELAATQLADRDMRRELREACRKAVRDAACAALQEQVRALSRNMIQDRLESAIDYGTLAGRALREAERLGLVDKVVEEGLERVEGLLAANTAGITAYFQSRLTEYLGNAARVPGVSGMLESVVAEAFKQTLTQLGQLRLQPYATPRAKLREALAGVLTELEREDGLRIATNEAVRGALRHADVGGRVVDQATQALEAMLRDLEREDSQILQALDAQLERVLDALRDESVRAQLDAKVKQMLGSVVGPSLGGAAAQVVERNLAGMSGKQFADEIEGRVGADLQFIRVSGAVVGGLCGAAIYLFGRLLG